MRYSNQIIINQLGSLAVMGEWTITQEGKYLGRIIAPTYREDELKIICQREGYDCSLKKANNMFTAIITNVEDFNAFMDLVIEFRKNLG